MSLGIFSTTSHCIAMTLIRTPSDSPPSATLPRSPPPNPIIHPCSRSCPICRNAHSRSKEPATVYMKGSQNRRRRWWVDGREGLISKSGDERQIRQIGPLISYQCTAVAAPLSLNLKNQLEQSKDGFNDLFLHTGGYRAKLRCLIGAAQACAG